mgnify:CR=1 FL=1
MATRRRLLLVEDEPGLVMTLSDRLIAEGYDVESATDARSGLEIAVAGPFDAILMDVMLPGGNGFDICRTLRQQGIQTPVLMLTARGQVVDRVVGLKLGADDYLIKPFSPGELAARARSVLRRSQPTPKRSARQGVVIDAGTRDVSIDGRAVELTAKEFDLLAFLVSRPRLVFSRVQLLAEVWASEPGWQSEATVTEHIHRLRQKVEPDPRQPLHLKTVRGVGYRFEG